MWVLVKKERSLRKAPSTILARNYIGSRKVINRTPRPVYELENLNQKPINGQFYKEELTLVRVTINIFHKKEKILDRRVRRGI